MSAAEPHKLRIGLVAGEISGDLLGAGLLQALSDRSAGLESEGIAGPRMQASGCRSLFPMERLAVMGLVEVLGRLVELLGIRRRLAEHFLANPPDAFIGIDAPDFNLGLERRLRRAGITTVHYVSPSVWAWRQRRVLKVAKAADCVLALFPFEAAFYRRHQVPVVFVGHPMADDIPMELDVGAARQALGIGQTGQVLALLPGSRMGEVSRLALPFLHTAAWLQARLRGLQVLVPCATPAIRRHMEAMLVEYPGTGVRLTDGRGREVLAACDAVLLASGTATLEAALLRKPMVVAYRMNALSYALLRRLIKVPYASLPNLLADRALVPEYFQEQVNADVLGPALLPLLQGVGSAPEMRTSFADMHRILRRSASERAAEAVLETIARRRVGP